VTAGSLPRIAVVDDDVAFRQALLGLLRSLGLEGKGYGNAEEFLTGGAACDCLITDYHMPGLSGLDLLRQLRAGGWRTPVVLISAHTEPGLLDRFAASGACCVLAKPFSEAQLLHCLRTALPARLAELD
jgi:FixJ family two-component response regulator